MRIIKDDNLERNVNKAISNKMKEYFENNNILKSSFNPMAEEPAKFKILIGKKEFFKNLETDLKKAITEELENNKVYVNNRIVTLKTDEVLTKIEKISSEKSRYSSYETIEKLPFEFLIKHYEENKIEDKITDKQLNIFLKLKKETFDKSINQILEKKEDDKLYLDDIKEVLNSIAKFENELGKYRYFEEEQTILDEKEVGLAIDLKTFQKIKENDWYKMETRIAKEILIPNYEKNMFDFVEKVKENFENDVISLKEFKKLADNFELINEKANIKELLDKKIENYIEKEKKETWEEVKNSLVTFSLRENVDAFFYQPIAKGFNEIYDTIDKEIKNKFLTDETNELLAYFYKNNLKEVGLSEKELNKINPVEYLEKTLLKDLKNELEIELKNNDYSIGNTYINYKNKKNNHIIQEYNDILDFVCQNINNPYPNINPLQYFNELGIGKLSEEKYKEKEEYYFVNNFYKTNDSEDKEKKIREDVYNIFKSKGDMSLLEANDILLDFKTFDNEKVIEDMQKLIPNIVERNNEGMKVIIVEDFKENMEKQLKILKETKELKIKEEKEKAKEYEKEF